jgi:1-acyl-sn-glycerol-3-phosphate acyltransferase
MTLENDESRIAPKTSLTSRPRRRRLAQLLADGLLKLAGWRLVGEPPDLPKYILIGAPHTTNWDFVLAMMLKLSSGVGFRWIGKEALFRRPHGWFFRLTGGIPVWRERRQNFVEQIVERINQADEMVVVLAPEGTRSKTPYWKTGFYYMALGANVPICMAFVDYPGKEFGFGPLLYPSGDIQADFEHLRKFYSQKSGLYPERHGILAPKPRNEAAG